MTFHPNGRFARAKGRGLDWRPLFPREEGRMMTHREGLSQTSARDIVGLRTASRIDPRVEHTAVITT